MLGWTILFLVIALLAGALGFTGVAGAAAYAERLTEKSWEQRGLLRRIGERVSQLVKPQA